MLIVMLLLFIFSVCIGVVTFDGTVKGTQLLWILTLILESVYLDYEVNKP